MASVLDLKPDTPAIELDRTKCTELLRSVGIARIVLSIGCIPVASPVNMVVFDGDVVFAIGRDSKLTSSVYGQVVSVEADDIDLVSGRGWSVLVTGVAVPLTEPAQVDRVAPLLQPRLAEPHPLLVRVPSTLISGSRVRWGTDEDSEHGNDNRLA